MAPRFAVRPLPGGETDVAVLTRWFRQFVEVRDSDGAERCIVSAVRAGADDRQLARHALRGRDRPPLHPHRPRPRLHEQGARVAGRRRLGPRPRRARARESSRPSTPSPTGWRSRTPGAIPSTSSRSSRTRSTGCPRRWTDARPSRGVPTGRSCSATTRRRSRTRLLEALRAGGTPDGVAGVVVRAAAIRIARFHTSNEFGDWDTALHTFTFANAVHQGLRRSPSRELVRGIFDAAMSVYLDRFLNVPAARLPEPDGAGDPDRAARVAPGAARPPAAGQRGGRARRRLPRRGRRAGAAAGRARRRSASRGPRLPHDPVRRGGLPPVRADRRPDLPDRRRSLPRRPRADRARAGPDVTISPAASTAAKSCTRTTRPSEPRPGTCPGCRLNAPALSRSNSPCGHEPVSDTRKPKGDRARRRSLPY